MSKSKITEIGKMKTDSLQKGFSLIELMIAMTITLSILVMAFYLLAQSLNSKTRDEAQINALADANHALRVITKDVANAGFGLKGNGLVAASCLEDKIRVRANLNALAKQTTSNSVSDQDEDIEFFLVPNPTTGSALVRSDVGTANSAIIATTIDDRDINSDGDGDGLTFYYLDENGNEVTPENAVRIRIVIRVLLPEAGRPGSPGYQPPVTKQLHSSVSLSNSRLIAY
jgi:prepilin-type N-terminal cleavage/methylation domain-containing protein